MALPAHIVHDVDESPAGPGVGAFFDVDGTLIAGFSAVAFLRDRLFSGRMTPRDVVDNSYGVGLTVVLDDVKGHDVYQEHPLHKEFIARNKPNWKRVQIYDFK